MFRAELKSLRFEDRRASERFTVSLPASISVGGKKHTARLVNIVRGGAMLEAQICLPLRQPVTVNCGTISAEAVVIWSETGRIGVQFKVPLSDAAVNEQIARCTALQMRRERNSNLRSQR